MEKSHGRVWGIFQRDEERTLGLLAAQRLPVGRRKVRMEREDHRAGWERLGQEGQEVRQEVDQADREGRADHPKGLARGSRARSFCSWISITGGATSCTMSGSLRLIQKRKGMHTVKKGKLCALGTGRLMRLGWSVCLLVRGESLLGGCLMCSMRRSIPRLSSSGICTPLSLSSRHWPLSRRVRCRRRSSSLRYPLLLFHQSQKRTSSSKTLQDMRTKDMA